MAANTKITKIPKTREVLSFHLCPPFEAARGGLGTKIGGKSETRRWKPNGQICYAHCKMGGEGESAVLENVTATRQ